MQSRVSIALAVAAAIVAMPFLAPEERASLPAAALAASVKASAAVRPTVVSEEGREPVTSVDLAAYDLLLDTLPSATRERLVPLLERRIAADLRDLQGVARYERDISLLLVDRDYAFYQLLRESDVERAELQAFARSLPQMHALSILQERELLLARLRHRDEIQALELRAEVTEDVSEMERAYVNDVTEQGRAYYRNEFLSEARNALSEEQWDLLTAAAAEVAEH